MFPLLLSAALSVAAPNGPVSWSFAAQRYSQGLVEVALTATVDTGWHIYATLLENDLGPIPTTVRFSQNEGMSPVGELVEPTPEEVFDPNFEMQVRYHSGSPVFVQHFKSTSDRIPAVKGEVEFMVCNDKTCLPPEVVKFEIEVTNGETKH